jgi:hypothetical protein
MGSWENYEKNVGRFETKMPTRMGVLSFECPIVCK